MVAYLCAAMVLKKYRAMHNYNKVEKEIIDLLRDQDVRDIKLLGNTIQKAFFRAEKTAMLVDCANHKAKLFFPLRKPYNHEDRKEFAQLVSLLNFIDVLEQKGLIYLQPTNAGCELFFYENFKHSFLHGIQKNGNVKEAISQQEQIIYDTDEYEAIDVQGVKVPKIKYDFLFITKDGLRTMQSTDVSSLYDRIYRLLCSRAFPTSALFRFIDNGYCLDEEKRSINSLRYAKASFYIAMLALLVSMPCISVWYSNQHAYSTINTMQYNALIKKLDAIERNGKTAGVKFKQQENYNINHKFQKIKH